MEPFTTMLRGGELATVRPLEAHDTVALLAFGQALPPSDRLYLEDDFEHAQVITRLVNARQADNWRQLVATVESAIVGYAAVRQLHGWSNHVGDIVLLVSEPWRRSGLGTALAGAIFDAARDMGVRKVIVEMLDEQVAGRAIFERLGFEVEGRLRAHALDRGGLSRDLLVLAYHVL